MSTPLDIENIEMTWIKLEIKAFEDGTVDMDKELLGWYVAILLKMYGSKGGKLPYDLQLLGKRFGTTARVIRRVTDALMAQDKLYVADGFLRNRRCDKEREKLIVEYVNRHNAAVKRHSLPEVSGKFEPSFSEVSPELQPNFSQTIQNNSMISVNADQSWPSTRARSIRIEEKKNKERGVVIATDVATPASIKFPEIPALNGSTSTVVEKLARGINAEDPDFDAAYQTLVEAVGSLAKATPEKEPKVAPKKGTRLSEDWKLSRALLEWTTEHFVISEAQVEKEAIKFFTFWTSRAGATAVKLDWGKTWQNWIRGSSSRPNYKQRKPEVSIVEGATPGTVKPDIHTQWAEAVKDKREAAEKEAAERRAREEAYEAKRRAESDGLPF
jgi:hypothetical protein